MKNEINIYKKNIESLKSDLNKIKETGVLLENFEEKLKKANAQQNIILKKLIPYYREINIDNTKIYLHKLKRKGNIGSEDIIESAIVFKEDTIVVSNSKGDLYIAELDSSLYTVEWIDKINISIKISYIEKISSEELLLFGESGEIILIELREKIENNTSKKYFKVLKQSDRLDEYGFLEISKLEEKCYIRKLEEDRLEIFHIEVNSNEIKLIEEKREEIFLEDEIIDSFLTLNRETIFIATNSGNVYCYKKYKGKYILYDLIDMFDSSISNISKLDSSNENIIFFSSKGDFKIYNSDSRKICFEQFDNIGTEIFGAESKDSTAVMISQDGKSSIMEENNNKWYINKNKIEGFFTKVIEYKSLKYLLFDLDSNIYILHIDRICSVEDLYSKIRFD